MVFKELLKIFQGSFKSISTKMKDVSRKFLVAVNKFERSSKTISEIFKEIFREVLKVFQ